MAGAHNTTLVVLAVLIAVAASYTALDLVARVKASSSLSAKLAWLCVAALCMGGGIWSMHFVAMLAYSIPGLEMAYDPYLTGLSLVMAVVVTGVGFAVVSRWDNNTAALVMSGLFMGTGVVAMHYIGMAAMLMDAMIVYDAGWVMLSVVIAMATAIAALWFAFRSAHNHERIIAACFMGAAVSGMHFAGMRAATFVAHDAMPGMAGSGVSMAQGNLALAVTTITFLILSTAIVAATFDRRLAALVEREAQMLKRREEQFRSLYRNTPLPLHALDEEGRIEEVSNAWLHLMGYSRSEVVGRPLVNFMVEESARRRLQQDWPRLLREGEIREIEYRMVTRNGQFLDVLSTSSVQRDEAGVFNRVVGGLIDLTARKRAEEALRQSQKMEAIGQLTGGIAHDFNNLLAIIMGSLEMAKRRLPEDEKLGRLLDNAMEGARRGATLTQRMLSFARRQTLNPQSVDLKALVHGMTDMLERSLGPKIAVRTSFAPSLPLAEADPHQLEMAMLNLAVNARDAMAGEGTITITAEAPADIPPNLRPGRYVRLRCADDGEGMDAETLIRAQEPFFTTKGVGKGTGLGLSMVSGFAEQSGGTLSIRSDRGKGTIIDIWLPVSASTPDVQAEGPATASQDRSTLLEGHKVLLVDDDSLVLLSTETMLQELGAAVVATASPLEALKLIKQEPGITCVLTDYAMPGMTGAQLAAAIRVEKPDMPILFATGYASVPDEIAAYARIHKPFDTAALATFVSDVLPRASATILPFRAANEAV